MIYLLPNRGAKKKKYMPLYIGLGLFLVALVIELLLPRFLSGGAALALAPILRTKTIVSDDLAGTLGFAESKKTILDENASLKAELARLSVNLDALDILAKENSELKDAFGRKGSEKEILGRILSYPGISPYDTLIVDIGSDAGVKENNPVYVLGSVLIGKVSEVHARQSKILLYSSPGEKLLALLEGAERIQIDATGEGAGNFVARIPRDIPLSVGDPLILPALQSKIVATVESVEGGENEAFRQVHFKSPINILDIQWVQIGQQHD